MRDRGIDSLRGLGAIGVILCHWSCIFARKLYFPSGGGSTIWTGTPLNIITNGDLAVQFFFLISGYLLMKKTQQDSYAWSEKYLLRRIEAILKVVIPGIIFPFILMKLGLMFHLEAMEINPNLKFVVNFNNFIPTLKSLVKDFIDTLKSGSLYNGPLWTIHTEFLGSFLIILLSSFIKRLETYFARISSVIISMIIVIFVDYEIVTMLFGALLYLCTDIPSNCEIKNDKIILKINEIINDKLIAIILIMIAIYLATINCSSPSGIYTPIAPVFKLAPLLRAFGLFVIMLYYSRTNHHGIIVLSFIGKISSYIYIFHWPLLLSLGCFLYIQLYQRINYYLLILVILIVVFITTLILSIIYDRILRMRKIKHEQR